MNLSLRKELCEALGWRLLLDEQRHPSSKARAYQWAQPNEETRHFWTDGPLHSQTAEEFLPAYESNATLSEELLDRVCREKRWIWCVNIDATGIQYWCQIADFTTAHGVSVLESGTTPSEARAKALLSALRNPK